MRGSRKFYQMGSNSDVCFCLFLVDEGSEDLNTTQIEPSSACQQMAFCWRTDDDQTLNAGLVAL